MPLLTDIALHLGILGSIASLVGIPLALYSLRLTRIAAERSATEAELSKKAAETAKYAVEQVRSELKLVDNISGLERAVILMDDIKSFIRHSINGPVPDKISHLIQQLNEVRHSSTALSPKDLASIQDAVATLRKIESRIDSASSTEKGYQMFNTLISKQIDSIYPILIRLRSLIGENL